VSKERDGSSRYRRLVVGRAEGGSGSGSSGKDLTASLEDVKGSSNEGGNLEAKKTDDVTTEVDESVYAFGRLTHRREDRRESEN
jgi:hypothetical protein